MTTSTDADAIARDLNGATSLVIEQMHEAGMPICMREGETTWRTYHAGFDLSLFAQRITDACCDAILSYLASLREAQEPVAWRMRLVACSEPSDWSYYNGEPSERHRRYEYQPLYTAPPAPAGDIGATYTIEHDGFTGTVIGSYTTREGKEGVVLQQVGTKVVHVYGRKWLKTTETAPAPAGEVERLRGEIAYALTKRLVIDMPTARAAIDEAFAALNGGRSE